MKLSFRKKLFLPLAISWLCLLAVVTVGALRDRADRIEERETQIANAGDMAMSIVKEYAALAAAGRLTDAQARADALARIRALRYGATGYLLVIDSRRILMHPTEPALAGADVGSIKDPDGRQICVDALAAVRQSGHAYTYFMWHKPGATAPERKISYNVRYAPWDWTIMTGLYIGDVDAAFAKSLRESGFMLAAAGLALSVLMVAIARSIERSLGGSPEQAMAVATRIAQGDLDCAFTLPRGDAASLMAAMRDMRDELADIVRKVRSGTATIASASHQIAAGNVDLSSRTEERAAALVQTASSMEQLTAAVHQTALNAQAANSLAQSASGVARRGGEVVAQVVGTMGAISDSSRRVVDIVTVIEGIAFQTNILALNAAVEAARAGEGGKGFAVVAGEVRQLAHRAATAAREIKALIDDAAGRIEAGTKLAGEAGATMRDIVDGVGRVTAIIGEIALAAQEQTTGIAHINQAIGQMDQVTQQDATLVEEVAATSESMRREAVGLAGVVDLFKLADARGARMPLVHG
jgi:methyl-accepting chemotaxis protein